MLWFKKATLSMSKAGHACSVIFAEVFKHDCDAYREVGYTNGHGERTVVMSQADVIDITIVEIQKSIDILERL